MMLTFGVKIDAAAVRSFYVRRVFRIVPLFWIAIVFYLLFTRGEGFRIWAPHGISAVDVDLPRGILGSLGVVTVLYVATSLVLVGMVSYTQLKTSPSGDEATLSTAFTLVGANWASTIIEVGAIAGLTTVVMVLMLGQSRVFYAMSRDGLLPRALAKRAGRPQRWPM